MKKRYLILSIVIVFMLALGVYHLFASRSKEYIEPQRYAISSLEKGQKYVFDVSVERDFSYELKFIIYSPKRRISKLTQQEYSNYFTQTDYIIPTKLRITTIDKSTGQELPTIISNNTKSFASYYGRETYIKSYPNLKKGQYRIFIDCLETDPLLNNFYLEFSFE